MSRRATALTGISAFLGLFAVCTAFALLTPLSASPDEPDHWRQAYAVWSGQTDLIGHSDPGSVAATGNYQVPSYMAGYLAQCTYQQPSVTADCAPPLPDSTLVTNHASTHSYPPTFYLTTGWITRFTEGEVSLYGLRLVSGAAFAAFAAASLALLYQARAGWRAHFALLLGLTPSIAFLAGTTNPSALEAAAVGLLVVVQWRWFLAAGTRWHWYWFAALLVTGVVAAGIRPLSGLLIGVAVAATALATFPREHWRSYWWKLALVLGLLAVFVGSRLRGQVGAGGDGGGAATGESYLTSVTAVKSTLWKGLSLPDSWVAQMGWLDTGANPISTVAWFAAIGFVVLAVLDWSRRRRLTAQLVLLALLTMWIYLDTTYTRAFGMPFWQARYGAPLALLALVIVPLSRKRSGIGEKLKWQMLLATILMLVAFLTAALLMLIRYAWGPDWQGPQREPSWLPLGGGLPLSGLLLLLLAVGVVTACLGPVAASRARLGRDANERRNAGGAHQRGDNDPHQVGPQYLSGEGEATDSTVIPAVVGRGDGDRTEP